MVDLIDRNELLEYVWRCRLDSRERIDELVRSMPTVPFVQPEPCEDAVSRQAAIDALTKHAQWMQERYHETCSLPGILNVIEELPSAQPERLTDDDFETIRIHLNAIKEKLCNQRRWEEANEYQRIIDRFMAFASAQPEPCDDAVSRKAVIDAVFGKGHGTIKGRLEALPSVTPKAEQTEYIPDTKAVRSKRDCVDLAERVTATFYDQEHEEWTQQTVTIADVLDSVCDEYTILPSAQLNNQVNLCDSCKHTYPDCPSQNDDVIFGNGNGDDNICACAKYAPSAQPERIQKDTTEYTHNEWVEYFMKRYWLSRQSAEDIMTIIPIIARLKRDEEKEGEQE